MDEWYQLLPRLINGGVFTGVKSPDGITVSAEPGFRLMLLGEGTAFAPLTVSTRDGLAAGGLNLVANQIMLHDTVIIDCFAALILQAHY
jgi:hypothetical protein